ncbi:MAG: thioredoxin-disulfide reductase [Candidatus Daviesbacteria bacterium]|nr:thioredoxin-disulfide reductase [Candidatus Daviesbacteria bacterium]
MEEVLKVVIIGSGPAGLTAAIYCARGNLEPVVITGRTPGGQLMITTDVDDFPGFSDGIQGPELMDKMIAQAKRLGTKLIYEDVSSVNLKSHPFIIKTETSELKTRSIIIATGASAKWLGLPSEQKFLGKGVSACAVCDGAFFKGKVIAVVGGGDTAMREAQHLSKFGSRVLVIHRRGEFRAQAALQEAVKSKANIKFLMNHTVEEVLGESKVTGLKVRNVQTGEVSEIQSDALFVAIGHQPSTEFLKGELELDDRGYVVVKDETRTSVEGVFVAGDAADQKYRQAVTAAGTGCKAAFDVEEYLEEIKLPTDGTPY